MTSEEAPAETQVGNDGGCGTGGWDVVRFWRCVCNPYSMHLFLYIIYINIVLYMVCKN